MIQHCHVDGEGSVRAVTHADGSLMQRIDCFPFGEPRRLESSRYDQPFRHHKGERELGGFTRQGARFNIARYGRLGALDPILLRTPEKKLLGDPLRLHPYAYARNNPLDWTDPTGEFPAAVAPLLGPFLANPAGLTAAAALGGAVLAAGTVSPQARELISDLTLRLLESGASVSTGDGGGTATAFRIATGKGAFGQAVKELGLDENKASEALHKIKKTAGRGGGGDDVAFDLETGDVIAPETGEVIGNLNDG